MAQDVIFVTTVSARGLITLPEAVRARLNWNAGTRLVAEDTPDGVILREALAFAPTPQGSAFGILKTKRKPKSA
ncbi:AbrB/MazE/SpoVT family DNA-binding domain-containing protein [Rhizobium sp. 16-449-1b]|uniref:AbrB/MazE/SpoVT family DNA-binding domain-containing protein n=1 Tax=Rhizobium sp. 16-449-1b TaxID=2819989 RepID=UPI001ADD438E|nr:AbrB/MazE/SpoVT family DNA-binding domain-containing protein [Rhizobium sp. 16-449-1b]MBO9192698.1 AbrB/MazE/SpoVT family DNA-binding domain-containing protein [Rhizobium sp. 16-449-1b]